MRLKFFISLSLALFTLTNLYSQSAMQNVMGREKQSLNGKWAVITDLQERGDKQKWWIINTKPSATSLRELSYEGGLTLNVPGDWNSQNPEFFYYEGSMWYKTTFEYKKVADKRQFLHFSGVSTIANVYLNGKKLGEHYGGFTPFQFEVSGQLKEGENVLIVKVNNTRTADGIPSLNFDWWNYGGITRDVDLVSTPKTYIEDYWVRLDKDSQKKVVVDVSLDGAQKANQEILVSIKGTKIKKKLTTDAEGKARVSFDAKLKLWSPESPTLYEVLIESAEDKITDLIGFRNFQVKGTELLLNSEPLFLRGINIHEEIASEKRRSVNAADAEYLTNQALELECNYIRLSHYPHNEYMLRAMDKKGLLSWEEIPTWGPIQYTDVTKPRITLMMKEMIKRDKNRCGVIIWSICNETHNSKLRNAYFKELTALVHELDNTRAVSAASNIMHFKGKEATDFTYMDNIGEYIDIIGVNTYPGWYNSWNWRKDPKDTKWDTVHEKPFIISEFGAGALYGQHKNTEVRSSWSEEYQAKAYSDVLSSLDQVANFRGIAPWVLFDFRSPRRAHSTYQQGWNRKGILSPEGDKKQAWYVLRDYYKTKK